MTLEEQVRADPRFAKYPPLKQMQLVGLARKRDTEGKSPATRGIFMEALPVGGAIVGGMAGGPAAPLTAALGAGIGEEAAQTIESLRGQRQHADIPAVLRTAGTQGVMEAVGAPVAKAAGRVLKAAGPKIADAVLPRSMYEARVLQTAKAAQPWWQRVADTMRGRVGRGPQTVAKTIVQRGLAGTETGLGVQAKRATRMLWNKTIQPALKQSRTKIDMPSFFDEIEAHIVNTNPELARQADLIEALQSLRQSYERVGDVSLEQLQRFKQGWAKFVPEKSYLGKPIGGAFNEVKDMAADQARREIYAELGPDIRKAYLDYGNLTNVIEHGQKAMTGQLRRGGFGGFWSAIKDTALTPVATVGAQVVYRTGKGLELVGAPGARVIRDLLPGIPEVGRDIQSVPMPAPLAMPVATPISGGQ